MYSDRKKQEPESLMLMDLCSQGTKSCNLLIDMTVDKVGS